MSKSIWGDIPTRTVSGKEIPEQILIENGIKATEEYFTEYENRRPFLPESVLRKMAAEIARNITIRTYVDGNSKDERRKSTPAEYEILYKLALSALLGLNHGETARQSKIAEDAIINAIEYTLVLMIPSANSYDSLYTPLRKTVENWRNHTQAEINFHYGEC